MASTNGGGDLGFEAQLFKAADKLRQGLEPSDYKHVVLGLVFLKYVSEAFEAQRQKLEDEDYADPEDPEEYLAENVFWVPKEARWSHLQANAKRPEIGKLIEIGVDGMLISWVDYKTECKQWIDEVLPLMEQAGQRAPVKKP